MKKTRDYYTGQHGDARDDSNKSGKKIRRSLCPFRKSLGEPIDSPGKKH
jgi:hypothetical protein